MFSFQISIMTIKSDNACEKTHIKKENVMSTNEHEEEKTAFKWQAVFDNIWLLFLLSLLISGLIYNVWGIIDLMNVPPAP